jgi:hypothetical protein
MNKPLSKKVIGVLRRTPLRRVLMAYRHRGITADDVFLASYPRSGNTWLKSLISSCLFGEGMTNFSDKENDEMPIVGFHFNARPLVHGTGRLIKTHEPYRKEYKKAIWIVRDPRDVLVSECRLALRNQHFFGTLDEYTGLFVNKAIYAMATWEEHTLSWINSPIYNTPQMLSLRFEALRADPEAQLLRILEFLAIEPTDEIVERAIRQNSIDMVAARHASYDKSFADPHAASIPAINSGTAGGWRNTLSDFSKVELQKKFGRLMAQLGYDDVN